MQESRKRVNSSLSLVDALEHLLDRGAVVRGEATISLAEIDLIYLHLELLLASAEKMGRSATSSLTSGGAPLPPRALPVGGQPEAPPGRQPGEVRTPPGQGPGSASGSNMAPEPPGTKTGKPEEHPGRSLAQLVLSVVELLRELVERRALRRAEKGDLSLAQEERLGRALMDLEDAVEQLLEIFDIKREELKLALEPVGDLIE